MATGLPADIRYCAQCGRPSNLEELARFGDTLICPNCKPSYTQMLREGVTPIQPVFRYAGFWIRFVAVLIDGIIVGVVNWTIQALLLGGMVAPMAIRPNARPEEAFAAMGAVFGAIGMGLLVGIALSSCYEAFFISRMGATPGKMVFGLKVVRPNGAPLTLGRAFGRYFAKMLSSMTLTIGYIIAAFDAQKRSLHDMIADTRVVKADGLPQDPYARPV